MNGGEKKSSKAEWEVVRSKDGRVPDEWPAFRLNTLASKPDEPGEAYASDCKDAEPYVHLRAVRRSPLPFRGWE